MPPKKTLLTLIFIIPIFLITIYQCFHVEFWLDEILTERIIKAPFQQHLNLVYKEYDHPPLYFHTAWLIALLPVKCIYLRFFSSLLGFTAVFFIAKHIMSISGENWKKACGVFLFGIFISPPIIYQFSNLRHYAFWFLFGMLYLITLNREIFYPTKKKYLSVIFAVLALLTHHFSLFLILSMELFSIVILWRREKRNVLNFTIRRIAYFLPFFILWGIIAYSQYPGAGGEKFVLKQNKGLTGVITILSGFHGFYPLLDFSEYQLWGSLFSAIIILIADIIILFKVKENHGRYLFWLTAFAGPVLMLLIVSLKVPVLCFRFLIISGAALWVFHSLLLAKLKIKFLLYFSLIVLPMPLLGNYYFCKLPLSFPYSKYIPLILETAKNDLLVLPPGSQEMVYNHFIDESKIKMREVYIIPTPIFNTKGYEEKFSKLSNIIALYNRVYVPYEIPSFWDKDLKVQKYFEAHYKTAKHQNLYGTQWVVVCYER